MTTLYISTRNTDERMRGYRWERQGALELSQERRRLSVAWLALNQVSENKVIAMSELTSVKSSLS